MTMNKKPLLDKATITILGYGNDEADNLGNTSALIRLTHTTTDDEGHRDPIPGTTYVLLDCGYTVPRALGKENVRPINLSAIILTSIRMDKIAGIERIALDLIKYNSEYLGDIELISNDSIIENVKAIFYSTLRAAFENAGLEVPSDPLGAVFKIISIPHGQTQLLNTEVAPGMRVAVPRVMSCGYAPFAAVHMEFTAVGDQKKDVWWVPAAIALHPTLENSCETVDIVFHGVASVDLNTEHITMIELKNALRGKSIKTWVNISWDSAFDSITKYPELKSKWVFDKENRII